MVQVFKVRQISAGIDQGRLCVTAYLQEVPEGPTIEARLPARETAALLPREILLGEERETNPRMLELMDEMLTKFVTGRIVRTWEYSGEMYFSFLKWGTVRFHSYMPASGE